MKIVLLLVSFFAMSCMGSEILKKWSTQYDQIENRCQSVTEKNIFTSPRVKRQSLINFLAHAQYYLIKKLIVSMTNSAKAVGITTKKFREVIAEVVQNQCSENLMFISKRNLIDVAMTRFSSATKNIAYSNSDLVESIKIFSDICSWHGGTHDKSMLSYYLKDSLVATSVIDNYVSSDLRVFCESDKCRLTSKDDFINKYSIATNKGRFENEVEATWCYDIKSIDHQVKFLDDNYTKKRLSQTSDKLKVSRVYLYSSIAGSPAPIVLTDWQENNPYFFSKLINDEKKWSIDLLAELSKKVEMEEELTVRYKVYDSVKDLDDLELNFDIASGEFDKLVYNVDKLTFGLSYKLKKTYIHEIISDLENIFIKNYEQRVALLSALKKEVATKVEKEFISKKAYKLPSLKKVQGLSLKIAEGLIENLKSFKGSKSKLLAAKDPEFFLTMHFSFGWSAIKKISALNKLDKK